MWSGEQKVSAFKLNHLTIIFYLLFFVSDSKGSRSFLTAHRDLILWKSKSKLIMVIFLTIFNNFFYLRPKVVSQVSITPVDKKYVFFFIFFVFKFIHLRNSLTRTRTLLLDRSSQLPTPAQPSRLKRTTKTKTFSQFIK